MITSASCAMQGRLFLGQIMSSLPRCGSRGEGGGGGGICHGLRPSSKLGCSLASHSQDRRLGDC